MGFTDIKIIVLIFLGVAALIAFSIILIKMINTPDHVERKYAGSVESRNLFVKKYKEADFEYYRGPAMRVGLISVLLVMIFAFNYSSKTHEASEVYQMTEEEIIEQDIPVTNQVQPPPPPPPPPPPVIEVVEDEVVVEEAPVLEELEIDVDDAVAATEVVEVFEAEIVEEVETEPEEPDVFSIVEEMPSFPGGEKALLQYLSSNIKYPPIASENGIEGTVVLRLVVNESGGISDIQVVRDIGGGCGNEAIRVVKAMPKWTPGKQRGRPVRVYYTLPIRFILE